jgi:hypothetical protein
VPVLKNPKRERFAQELAKGKSQIDAYETAGYRPDSGAAARLSGIISVRARVAELQAAKADRVVELTAIDRATVLNELAKIAMAGLDHENVRVADKRGALMDYARIEGWVVERTEHGSPGDFDRMSDDELREYVAGRTDSSSASQKSAGASGTSGHAEGKPH